MLLRFLTWPVVVFALATWLWGGPASSPGQSPCHRTLGALKGSGQIERDLGHVDVARELYEEAVVCRRA